MILPRCRRGPETVPHRSAPHLSRSRGSTLHASHARRRDCPRRWREAFCSGCSPAPADATSAQREPLRGTRPQRKVACTLGTRALPQPQTRLSRKRGRKRDAGPRASVGAPRRPARGSRRRCARNPAPGATETTARSLAKTEAPARSLAQREPVHEREPVAPSPPPRTGQKRPDPVRNRALICRDEAFVPEHAARAPREREIVHRRS